MFTFATQRIGFVQIDIEVKIWHDDDVEIKTICSVVPASILMEEFKVISYNICYLSEPAKVTLVCNGETFTYMNIPYMERQPE